MRRLEARDLTAEMREIVRRGRLELTGRRYAVGRVTGHHLVNRGRVIEQPCGRVAHRANQRCFVQLLRQQRHDLRNIDSGNDSFDRLEVATDIRRRVRLRVPNVDVAWSALQENQEHRLGFAPTGPAFAVRHRVRVHLQAQYVGKAQAEEARAAHAQKLASRESVTSAAR